MGFCSGWRDAPTRTNVVRAVGLVVAAVVGAPIAIPTLRMTLHGAGRVLAGDVGGLGFAAWGVVALGALGVSCYALVALPTLDDAASRRCTRWAIAGTIAALPLLAVPMIGAPLVGAGFALTLELETRRIERRAVAR